MFSVELTATDVDLIQGILWRGQHPHVWSEFLSQCLDDVLCCRCAGHSDTLCGKVTSNPVLEVEAHHTMELQVLLKTETRPGMRNVCWIHAGWYGSKCPGHTGVLGSLGLTLNNVCHVKTWTGKHILTVSVSELPEVLRTEKMTRGPNNQGCVWPTAQTGKYNKVI